MSPAERPEALLLTPEQLADLLGTCRQTVYRLDSAGKLPMPLRLIRGPRWRKAEIVAWLNASAPPRCRWRWPEGREVRR